MLSGAPRTLGNGRGVPPCIGWYAPSFRPLAARGLRGPPAPLLLGVEQDGLRFRQVERATHQQGDHLLDLCAVEGEYVGVDVADSVRSSLGALEVREPDVVKLSGFAVDLLNVSARSSWSARGDDGDEFGCDLADIDVTISANVAAVRHVPHRNVFH